MYSYYTLHHFHDASLSTNRHNCYRADHRSIKGEGELSVSWINLCLSVVTMTSLLYFWINLSSVGPLLGLVLFCSFFVHLTTRCLDWFSFLMYIYRFLFLSSTFSFQLYLIYLTNCCFYPMCIYLSFRIMG